MENPDKPIYILGMLVHNRHVIQALHEMNITTIDDKKKTRMELLDDLPNDGIVIFTAHGIAPDVIAKAEKKGLTCVDASCPDVVKTQELVKDKLEQHFEILYIGKKAHPEAEAICSLSSHVHLITSQDDISQIKNAERIFVTNQTTMSVHDVEHLFALIKAKFPQAEISEEICNATRIRQQAVRDLENKGIDVLYVVGDKYSNNSNRLAQIAQESGIHHVYLIDDVNDILDAQLEAVDTVAVTSGASTPTYLTSQVISYLEHYETGCNKPIIDVHKIL